MSVQELTASEKLEKKFKDIDEEWRDKVAALSAVEVKAVLAELAYNENENQKAKEEDQDLASKKESYDSAAEGYKEATKSNKLKTKYALKVLSDKGGI